MENHPKINKSASDNGLRMRGGFPYNPKVSRNKEIPGGSISGVYRKKKTQAQSWSEEKWE
jgi:hypothetical protein